MTMIMDPEGDLRALSSTEIRTHKDALGYFSVRYSSFTPKLYPADAPLPAFTLAKHGFYLDAIHRELKCPNCDYKTNDLYDELLVSVLQKHFAKSPNCKVALNSLKSILTESAPAPVTEQQSVALKRPIRAAEKAAQPTTSNSQFVSEEARVRSFESEKLAIGVNNLAANGLYRVPKPDPLLSKNKPSKKLLVSAPRKAVSSTDEDADDQEDLTDEETEQSQIETIARSLPAMYHVRCAFCPYECLLFKSSLLNTLYKSPFDEHRDKFGSVCPIFALNSDMASRAQAGKMGVDLNRDIAPPAVAKDKHQRPVTSDDLSWLQTLYEFEWAAYPHTRNQPVTTRVLSSSNGDNDLELTQMPKILDKLYAVHSLTTSTLSTTQPRTSASTTTAKASNPLLYMPGSSNKAALKAMTSNDFSKLQSVLNSSDNVLSRKAYNPTYAQYQTRLESFKEWPASMSQQPADLAKAGFYYFGIKDMVKCFFCNGGLKNWDHNDDPFLDHVRWFPACQYIRQLMGHDYVEEVRERFKNLDSGFGDEATAAAAAAAAASNSSGKNPFGGNRQSGSEGRSLSGAQMSTRSVSPRTLNSRMDSSIVRKIVDSTLISRESIRNAIELKLSTQAAGGASTATNRSSSNAGNVYNDDFRSPIEMALASYAIDKNKRDKRESFERISDFVIFNLSQAVHVGAIVGYLNVRHNVNPSSCRILREQGRAENRCFCLVSLQTKDRRILNDIIKDISRPDNQEFNDLRTSLPIKAVRTVWSEVELQLKPVIDKPTPAAVEPSVEDDSESSPDSEEQTEAMDTSVPVDNTNTKAIDDESKLGGESSSVDDATQLKEENERLKSERLCVVCLSREKNVLFLPCAHLTACLECSLSFQQCPLCRTRIQATVRTFT